jgi:hypothetical protein
VLSSGFLGSRKDMIKKRGVDEKSVMKNREEERRIRSDKTRGREDEGR